MSDNKQHDEQVVLKDDYVYLAGPDGQSFKVKRDDVDRFIKDYQKENK